MQDIAQHYDHIAQQESKREDTNVLRYINNFAKTLLLEKTYELLKSEMDSMDGQIHIADFACGKGGDILKWSHVLPVQSIYMGIDLSEDSCHEAFRRLTQCSIKREGHSGKNKLHFGRNSSVSHGNIASKSLEGLFLQKFGDQQMHIVSMQMAMHYFTKNEDLLNNLLYNVSSVLQRGGLFVATFMNENCVLGELRSRMCTELSLESDLQEIPTQGDFGISYRVSLPNCLKKMREYVIPLKQTYAIAKKYGLLPIYVRPIPQILNDSVQQKYKHVQFLSSRILNTNILEDVEHLRNVIDYDAGMYMAVIFKKL
jgi:hypothetical protein